MTKLVHGALLEAAKMTTTWVDFGSEDLARQRLHIPARLKGGWIRNISDLHQQTFVGAILDILPSCIDIANEKREIIKGV
jgi:hypothetical protein